MDRVQYNSTGRLQDYSLEQLSKQFTCRGSRQVHTVSDVKSEVEGYETRSFV